MSLLGESLVLIGLLTVLLVGGVWISLALAIVGWAGLALFSPAPAGAIFATTSWGAGASWTLAALPLFVWMGEILFRTNLSEQLFRGITPWVLTPAGRVASYQYLCVRRLCSHRGVLGCHKCDGGQDGAAGTAAAGVS